MVEIHIFLLPEILSLELIMNFFYKKNYYNLLNHVFIFTHINKIPVKT